MTVYAFTSANSPFGAGTGRTRRDRPQRGVLTWLVTALANVDVARLGVPEDGPSFVLAMHTDDRTVGAGDVSSATPMRR